MKKDFQFQFSAFGKRVQMFHSDNMGIVVEKEPQVVCVYATDAENSKVYCALPLCHPKYLKGMAYQVAFYDNSVATVSAGDVWFYIDFNSKKCANNKGLQAYGSVEWGQDVAMVWHDSYKQSKES